MIRREHEVPRFLSRIPLRLHFEGAGDGGSAGTDSGGVRGGGGRSAAANNSSGQGIGSAPGSATGPAGQSVGQQGTPGQSGPRGSIAATTTVGLQGTTSPVAAMLASLTGISALGQAPSSPSPAGTQAGGAPSPVSAIPGIPAATLTPSARKAEATKVKRGRRASILTSSRGVDDDLGGISRPRAGATLFGG